MPPFGLEFDDAFADADGHPAADVVPTTVALSPVDGGTHLTITTRFADVAGLAAAQDSGMDTGFAETPGRPRSPPTTSNGCASCSRRTGATRPSNCS